jgi:hypothetical protein
MRIRLLLCLLVALAGSAALAAPAISQSGYPSDPSAAEATPIKVTAEGISCPFFGAALSGPVTTRDSLYSYEPYSAGADRLWDDATVCVSSGDTATTAHQEVAAPACKAPEFKSVDSANAEVADFPDGQAIIACSVPDDNGAGKSNANSTLFHFLRQDFPCAAAVDAGSAGATHLQLTTSSSVEVDDTYTTYLGGTTTSIMTVCVGELGSSGAAPSSDTHRQVACQQGSPWGGATIPGEAITATFTDGQYAEECITPDIAPPPVTGENVNATPVSGTVLIKLPHQHKYSPLVARQQIPLGALVNTLGGTIWITSAKGHNGHIGNGHFWDGVFRLTQQTTPTNTLTVLTLAGTPACGSSSGGYAADAPVAWAARKKPPPHLWGHANGNFKTVGGFASATERGTKWLTEDTCSGTLIHVAQGAVTVDDFRQHRTFLLKAPHSFLAGR